MAKINGWLNGSFFALLAAAAAFSVAPRSAEAQGQSQAPIANQTGVRSFIAPLRVIPVAGASSFTTNNRVSLDNFGDGFSAGVYGDWGSGALNFETGVLSLNSRSERTGEASRSFQVNSWGIPLLAKLHFGNPHQSVFVKAGAMPFQTTGSTNEFNVMGVGGLGGHIPLGLNSSILVEATYNRLFTNTGDLTNYQGVALLGGLALNL